MQLLIVDKSGSMLFIAWEFTLVIMTGNIVTTG